MKEKLGIKGHIELVLTDENGNVKDVRVAENMIVSGGLGMIADAISKASNTWIMSGMGIGTGTTGAATTDINLESSADKGYNTLTSAGRGATAASSHSIIYTATFGAGNGTGAITEAVLCCAASADGTSYGVGRILNRVTFSAINKAAADSLTITWTIVLADA